MRYRPLLGQLLTALVTLLGVVAVGAVLLEGFPLDALRAAPVVALVVVLCWALFWLPVLIVEEHAVTVRNVFVTHHVPWAAIERIDTKYALTLDTPGKRITVWVAPAPTRIAAREATRGEALSAPASARAAERSVRPGDLPTSESGAAAAVLRRHWEQLRDDGVFDRLTVAPRIRTKPNLATLVTLGVLVVATAISVAL